MKRSSLREREVMRGSESCSFPWRLALRSAAQGTNLKASHHDHGDDGSGDDGDGDDDGRDDGGYDGGDSGHLSGDPQIRWPGSNLCASG